MSNYLRKKAFTLIELLVVISIIALLSSVVIASLTGARKKAQWAVYKQELNSLRNAISMYLNDGGEMIDLARDMGGYYYASSASSQTGAIYYFSTSSGKTAEELAPYIPAIPIPSDPSDVNLTIYTYGTYGYSCNGNSMEADFSLILQPLTEEAQEELSVLPPAFYCSDYVGCEEAPWHYYGLYCVYADPNNL